MCMRLLVQLTEWRSNSTNQFKAGFVFVTHFYRDLIHSSPPQKLTLNVRGPNCSCSTWRISWLVMFWALVPPGHQHPWIWLCTVCKFLYYIGKDFNYLCHVSVEEWYKLLTHFYALFEKFSVIIILVHTNCPRYWALRDWSRTWPVLTWLDKLGVAVSSSVRNTFSQQPKLTHLISRASVW